MCHLYRLHYLQQSGAHPQIEPSAVEGPDAGCQCHTWSYCRLIEQSCQLYHSSCQSPAAQEAVQCHLRSCRLTGADSKSHLWSEAAAAAGQWMQSAYICMAQAAVQLGKIHDLRLTGSGQ